MVLKGGLPWGIIYSESSGLWSIIGIHFPKLPSALLREFFPKPFRCTLRVCTLGLGFLNQAIWRLLGVFATQNPKVETCKPNIDDHGHSLLHNQVCV